MAEHEVSKVVLGEAPAPTVGGAVAFLAPLYRLVGHGPSEAQCRRLTAVRHGAATTAPAALSGLTGVLSDLGARFTDEGDGWSASLRTTFAPADWTDEDADYGEAPAPVVHVVHWTMPTRLAIPLLAEGWRTERIGTRSSADRVTAMVAKRRAWQAGRNILRTGEGGSVPMSATLPAPLDHNDGTADEGGYGQVSTVEYRAGADVRSAVALLLLFGMGGHPLPAALVKASADEGKMVRVTVKASRRGGNGYRVLTHATPAPMVDGRYRVRRLAGVGETPDRGHTFTRSAPALVAGSVGPVLGTFIALGIHVPAPYRGALPVTGRCSRTGRTVDIRTGASLARVAASKSPRTVAQRAKAEGSANVNAALADLAARAAAAGEGLADRIRKAPVVSATGRGRKVGTR